MGWAPAHVARSVGYEDASECARRIGAAFELGKREVDTLSTRTVVACYGASLVRAVRRARSTSGRVAQEVLGDIFIECGGYALLAPMPPWAARS